MQAFKVLLTILGVTALASNAAARTISGQVLGEDGKPIANAVVFVQEPAATVIDAPVVETGAPVPVAPVAVAPVSAGHVRTAYNSRFAPDAVKERIQIAENLAGTDASMAPGFTV